MMALIPIAAFVTAYYLVNVVQWHVPFRRALKQRRVKPMDCVQCLSVWFAIGLYFSPIEISQALALIFSAGFISTKIQ